MKLVVFAALLLAVEASLAQPTEQRAGRQTGATNGDQSSIQDTAVAVNLSRLVRAIEAQNSDPKAGEDRQRAKDDLVAQQSMARWTLVIALVSVGALVLSTVGVILIYLTFRQTRVAARWAGIGARQSRRALRHMQTVSSAELRAYVGIEWVTVSGFSVGETPNAEIRTKNFGQTPAHQFDVFCYLALASADRENSLAIPDIKKHTPSSLPPSGSSISYPSLNRAWTQECADAFAAGSLNAYIFGEARYVDAFGQRRTTSFRNKYTNQCQPGRTLHCTDGNWSD